jgi:hypothetical protein
VWRRTAITSIFIVGLLIPAASVSAAHHRGRASTKCKPGHTRLIAADTQTQVFAVPKEEKVLLYVGCAYGHKKSFVIGGVGGCTPRICSATKHVTLAGPIAAYEEFNFADAGLGESSSKFLVVVQDLSTGRVLREVPTGTPKSPHPGLVGAGSTTAIVVTSDAAVAWIVESEFKPQEYQVHAVDKSGSRLLASGPGVGPSSLALAGSTLYWTQACRPFSAPLN